MKLCQGDKARYEKVREMQLGQFEPLLEKLKEEGGLKDHLLSKEHQTELITFLGQQYDSLVSPAVATAGASGNDNTSSSRDQTTWSPFWLDERIFLEDSPFDDNSQGAVLVGTPSRLPSSGAGSVLSSRSAYEGSGPHNSYELSGGFSSPYRQQSRRHAPDDPTGISTDPFAPVLAPFSRLDAHTPATPVTRMMEQVGWLVHELKDARAAPSASLRSLLRQICQPSHEIPADGAADQKPGVAVEGTTESGGPTPGTDIGEKAAEAEDVAAGPKGGKEGGGEGAETLASILKLVQSITERLVVPAPQAHDGHYPFAGLALHRKQLAVKLYYRVLEQLLVQEQRRVALQHAREHLLRWLQNRTFHTCLLSCCFEIVIFSYKLDEFAFPAVLHEFQLQYWDFLKVIESVVKACRTLPRLAKLHLRDVEVAVLDHFAWQSSDRLPYLLQKPSNQTFFRAWLKCSMSQQKSSSTDSPPHLPASPNSQSSPESDRSVYGERPAKRQRPDRPEQANTTVVVTPPGNSSSSSTSSPPPSSSSSSSSSTTTPSPPPAAAAAERALSASSSPATTPRKMLAPHAPAMREPFGTPRKGLPTRHTADHFALEIFLRKLLALAVDRLGYLCDTAQLNVPPKLTEIMWSLCVHVLSEHVHLLFDRHLDTIILSSIYGVYKLCESAGGRALTFTRVISVYIQRWPNHQGTRQVIRHILFTPRPLKLAAVTAAEPNAVANVTAVSGSSGDKGQKAAAVAPQATNKQAGGEEDNEVYGDIIAFYNKVFVPEVKSFMLTRLKPRLQQLLAHGQLYSRDEAADIPRRRGVGSSQGQVRSQQHRNIYLSPMRHYTSPHDPLFGSGRAFRNSYAFGESPTTNLQEMNRIINHGRRLFYPASPASSAHSSPVKPARHSSPVKPARHTLSEA